MRCTPGCLRLASALLVLGLLAPAVRAADSPRRDATADPGVGAEFRRLLQDLDQYLQAEHVGAPARHSENAKLTPADKAPRAARRFANGRLAEMEAESPLSAEERAEWRELVRRHAARATGPEKPLAPPGPGATAAAEGGTPQVAGTGVLSGRLTSAATGTGISGSAVLLYLDYSGTPATVYTDAAGNYSFTGLATGTYYVKTNNFGGYVDEAWDNVPCDYSCRPVWSGGTPIAVTDGATTPGIDFALDRGGRISGTVLSAATSAPIPNLAMTIWDFSSYRRVTYAYTDATGAFVSYGGLVSGTYRVRTETSINAQSFVDEWYDNVPCALGVCSPGGGAPITVTAPSTTGGINFVLDPGGGLSGKVTDAGTSTGLSGVSVQVKVVGGNGVTVWTDASGNWSTLLNAPAGSYLVSTSNESGYVDEVWDNVPCPGGGFGWCGGAGGGTLIDVSAGAVTSGIDFALDVGGRIAGRVTDAATTEGLSWAEVDIYTENGSYLTYAYTDGTGAYTTPTGLTTGRYRARTNEFGYVGSSQGYLDEVYDDKPCIGDWGCPLAAGDAISVSVGATTSGIDFALDKGGRISGNVTDAATSAGVELYVFIYSETGRDVSYGYTDATGSYTTFYSLPAGQYYAATYQAEGGQHVDEAYDNVPCAGCRPEFSGTPFGVTPGVTTPGIDFALDKGGTIAGRITSAKDGAGVSGWVWAYTLSGSVAKHAPTDASGNYAVRGLPPGRYLVKANTSRGFVNEVYDNQPCVGSSCNLAAGTPVAVTAGATTTANFVLSPGARVSGRVTDGATGTGIPGVTVSLVKPPAASVASMTTDGLGYFATAPGSGYGLPTGGYYVQTGNALGYLDEVYDNVPCVGCDVTAGTKVQLTAGATTSGINFALSKTAGGRISGTVTRSGTGEPLPLLTVRIYGSTGGLVSSLTTSYLGTYLTTSLPPGSYYVSASVDAADYADELYDNVPFCAGCSPAIGTPVAVVAGSTTSNIDFALDAGGRIEGRVGSASTGAPLLDASVTVYNAANVSVRSASVDALGHYAVHGLAAGTYHAVAGAGPGYVSELYANTSCPACPPNTGTPITVTAGNATSGIDFTLEAGGRIEGTVTRASDGNPVGAAVTIYDATGAIAAGSVQDGSGLYRSSSGLPSGAYYARAGDSAGTYDAELYSNRRCNSCDPTTGDAVTVTSPAATTGIDFSLNQRSLDFYTVNPCRVVDTRNPASALGGPALAAKEDRVLSVFAKCGIPLTAKALSVNLAATDSTSAGNLRLHPGGTPVPTTSALNYSAGQTKGNNALVPVSRFGEAAVYCGQATGTVHFILDVNGYFQ